MSVLYQLKLVSKAIGHYAMNINGEDSLIDLIIERALKRNPPTKPNIAFFWWQYVRNAKRTIQAQLYSPLHPDVGGIAQQLVERGVVFGPSDQYLAEEGRAALFEASAIVLNRSRSSEIKATIARGRSDDPKKDYIVHLISPDTEHLADSPLVRLGLDKKLLEIVSSYFGFWPRLQAISASLNFPQKDKAKHSQLFHRDPEDVKLIKVFIYLENVDENHGPFTYIPGTHPFGSAADIVPKHTSRYRVLDEDMALVLPQWSWLACTGPANTMILADTVGYHKGGKPTKGNRILIAFSYSSGKPFKGKDRLFSVSGRPSWTMDDIQRSALY
jgi:hypothetical protein